MQNETPEEKLKRIQQNAVKVKLDGVHGKEDYETETVRPNVQLAAMLRQELTNLQAQREAATDPRQIERLDKKIARKLADIANRESIIDEGRQATQTTPKTNSPNEPKP